jgi:hypothetical protein
LREISHTGGTTGFTAQVAFLPAADLGIAILSNASASPGALAFAFAVQFRLLELLFDQPTEMDTQLSAVAERGWLAGPRHPTSTRPPSPRTWVASPTRRWAM